MKVKVRRIFGFRASQLVPVSVDSVLMDGKEVATVGRCLNAVLHFNGRMDPQKIQRVHQLVQKIRKRQGLPPIVDAVTIPPNTEEIRQFLREKEWRQKGLAPEPEVSADAIDAVFEEEILFDE